MRKLNPYLNFDGDAEEAFRFYKSVFGGDYRIMRFKEMPIPGAPLEKEEENKVMHISLPIAGDTLMASDILKSRGMKLTKGNDFVLSYTPDSKEEAVKVFNSLSEGGEIEMPLSDQIWGDYYGGLKDKFGVRWMIDYPYPKNK